MSARSKPKSSTTFARLAQLSAVVEKTAGRENQNYLLPAYIVKEMTVKH